MEKLEINTSTDVSNMNIDDLTTELESRVLDEREEDWYSEVHDYEIEIYDDERLVVENSEWAIVSWGEDPSTWREYYFGKDRNDERVMRLMNETAKRFGVDANIVGAVHLCVLPKGDQGAT